jgi:hypothetical protein
MSLAWIAQEGSSLHAAAQVSGHRRDRTPRRHAATDREAPMGLERIHHPIVAPHGRQLGHHVSQRGGKIGTGAGLPDLPHDRPGRDHKRSDQRPDTMPDILVGALLGFPRHHRLGGVCAVQHLPTGLFRLSGNLHYSLVY